MSVCLDKLGGNAVSDALRTLLIARVHGLFPTSIPVPSDIRYGEVRLPSTEREPATTPR